MSAKDVLAMVQTGIDTALIVGELRGENKVLREKLENSESEKFFRHLNNGEVYLDTTQLFNTGTYRIGITTKGEGE